MSEPFESGPEEPVDPEEPVEPDDLPDQGPARHEALDQLDAWREEATRRVQQGRAGRLVGGISDLHILIQDELLATHGGEIAALADELKTERSRLQADIDSNEAQGIGPSQAEQDRIALLDDAIDALEEALSP